MWIELGWLRCLGVGRMAQRGGLETIISSFTLDGDPAELLRELRREILNRDWF